MARKKKVRKIFVLDTSVILHDHNSISCFAEHDVAIPITVLEELDNLEVIDIVDNVFKDGTEADQQIQVEKKDGINELLLFLMNTVEYKI